MIEFDLALEFPVAPVIDLEPQPEPTGVRAAGRKFCRVITDNFDEGLYYNGKPAARTLTDKIGLTQTNEFRNPRRWYLRDDGEWRVDQFSQIDFWPERLGKTWATHFYKEMTPKQRELFDSNHVGWRDSKASDDDELQIYSWHLCSGALLKVLGTWRHWTLFEAQDINDWPNPLSNPVTHPNEWFKQAVCGHNKDKVSYYGKVNPQFDDLFIPTACSGGIAAILTREVRMCKQPPFDTFWNGIPVRFVDVCHVGSESLGLTDDGLWLYIEQQVTFDGNQADFVLHIPQDDWCPVKPTSFKYKKRTE